MEEAVKIARTMDNIESAKTQLKIALKDLSSYTKHNYKIEDIEIADLETENIVPISNIKPDIKGSIAAEIVFNPELTAEAKYYDLEIEKKKAELEIYKRQRLPAFKFYTNYSFYGQNPDSEISSIKDVKQRSLSFGISSSLPIFDGFKNQASREKAFFEIEKIKAEKAKKLNELSSTFEKSYTSYLSYNDELKIKQELLTKIHEKLKGIERFIDNGLATKTDMLEQKAELLMQEIEIQKSLINISSKIKETKIITGDEI
jgi:outer membrane protein TolC